jgi:hypothetical protein
MVISVIEDMGRLEIWCGAVVDKTREIALRGIDDKTSSDFIIDGVFIAVVVERLKISSVIFPDDAGIFSDITSLRDLFFCKKSIADFVAEPSDTDIREEGSVDLVDELLAELYRLRGHEIVLEFSLAYCQDILCIFK